MPQDGWAMQRGNARMSPEAVRVSATGICKGFGGKAVLEGAALEVRAGEVVALVGENGAGKTTLLRICAGLIPAESGEVRVKGSIGYCPQEPGVFELLTAEEHLVLFGRALGLPRKDALAQGRSLLQGSERRTGPRRRGPVRIKHACWFYSPVYRKM